MREAAKRGPRPERRTATAAREMVAAAVKTAAAAAARPEDLAMSGWPLRQIDREDCVGKAV